MILPFDVVVDKDEKDSPSMLDIQLALDEIAYNTRNGDNGPVGPDRIEEIYFYKENGQWRYTWSTGRKFERIRRITGYLTGTLDRFNDAKKHEERDRVKHSI